MITFIYRTAGLLLAILFVLTVIYQMIFSTFY